MRLRRFFGLEVIMAFALAGMAYSFVLSGGSLTALIPAQGLAIVIPVLVMLSGKKNNLIVSEILIWLIISALLTLGILANMGGYMSGAVSLTLAVMHLCGLVGMLFALQWTACNLRPEVVFRNVAILLLPLMAGALFVGLLDGGFLLRQSPLGIHPNWWGELATCFVFGALAMRNWIYRFLFIATAAVLLVLVQSRGAILAVSVGLLFYGALSFGNFRARLSSVVAVLLVGVIASVVVVSQPQLREGAVSFVVDNVLVLNDPERGVGTGLTGRLEGWQRAAEVFAENLIVGGGLDTLPEVHNGFLRIAGENGLSLLILFAFLLVRAFYESYIQSNAWRFAVIAAYVAYVMTYPRMLNMNLAAGLFFVCMFSWPRRAREPAPSPLGRESADATTLQPRAGRIPATE